MKVTKEDIIYICWLPFILLAMAMGGFLLLIVWGLLLLYGGVMWLWNGINYLTPYEPMTPSEKKYWKRFFRLDGIGKK